VVFKWKEMNHESFPWIGKDIWLLGFSLVLTFSKRNRCWVKIRNLALNIFESDKWWSPLFCTCKGGFDGDRIFLEIFHHPANRNQSIEWKKRLHGYRPCGKEIGILFLAKESYLIMEGMYIKKKSEFIADKNEWMRI
jgi:hypothetical protein